MTLDEIFWDILFDDGKKLGLNLSKKINGELYKGKTSKEEDRFYFIFREDFNFYLFIGDIGKMRVAEDVTPKNREGFEYLLEKKKGIIYTGNRPKDEYDEVETKLRTVSHKVIRVEV